MHRRHRERFLETLAANGASAVVPSGSARIRNHDCHYRFRPESDFVYLTGFAEEDSVLVLLPHADQRAVLFLRERDQLAEIWNGRRLGTERAPEALGVDAAYPIEELWERLPELLEGSERVVYRTGADEDRDRRMISACAGLRQRVRGGARAPAELVDPSLWLHEQRLVKDADEIAVLRRAAAVTAEAHQLAMAAAAPGKNEREIDALLDYTFRARGGTGQAYSNIVAGGANACILHYTENDAPLVDGELLLIDAGCEFDYYASDVTRTFPVNGRFDAEQRALYDVVLTAQKEAVAAARPGATALDLHAIALRRLVEGLVGLGLLRGDVDACIEDESYERFYMHKTGHWMGLDVHDCGAYFVDGVSRELEPGFVTTVEPGLYVAADDETVEERWRGIGIRIEDDVLITPDGHEVLTAATPKELEDVEAACNGEALLPA